MEAYKEPTPEELAANQGMLVRRLRADIAAWEERYELPSRRLQGELVAGRLRETSDLVSWLIAWNTLQRIESDERRPARLERVGRLPRRARVRHGGVSGTLHRGRTALAGRRLARRLLAWPVALRQWARDEVDKSQVTRRRSGRLEVKTVDYKYHVQQRKETGVRKLFRYDDADHHPGHPSRHHRHAYRAGDADDAGIVTHVGYDGWPTLGDVIGEAFAWWEANCRP